MKQNYEEKVILRSHEISFDELANKLGIKGTIDKITINENPHIST